MQNSAAAFLAGRVLLSLVFLYDGFMKITTWGATSDFMAAIGLPMVPVLLAVVVIVELVGGLTVLTGFQARTGALALLILLVPITLVFHDFWDVGDTERGFQIVEFLRNLGLMGGLLIVGLANPASKS